jgi:SAM-dependent methyltransferase
VQFVKATESVDPWYHSFFFDNGFEVRGSYDIGRNVHEYGFPSNLTGLKVLDIGPATGWFSFYFEQIGADVTAVDVRSWFEIDDFGRYARPVHEGPTPEWVKGFNAMAELLGSNIKRVGAPVYDLSPDLFDGVEFDLVFVGAVLLHVRDPIGALMAARRVCRDRLIATNWFLPAQDALGKPLPDRPAEGPPTADLPYLSEEIPGRGAWWRPNRSAYELWFRAAGFRTVDVSRTVTLTADVVRPEHYNSTMTLLLADARV